MSKSVPSGFNVPTSPPAYVTVEEVVAKDLRVIEMLQRGHGQGTPGWSRARKLANDWKPDMVGFLTLVEVCPDQAVDIVSTDGTMVTNGKGETFFHCADGFTRATAAYMVDENTPLLAVVYRFEKMPSWERQCGYAAERFYERNSLPAPVRSADKLRVEYEMGETHAIKIVEACKQVDIILPFETYHWSQKEKRQVTADGRNLSATGALVNLFRKMADGDNDPDLAERALCQVLAVNAMLFPVAVMRSHPRVEMKSRWQGDFLMALFRLLQSNAGLADILLAPSTPTERRQRDEWIKKFQTHSVAGGMIGPKGWSNHANKEAAADGRTMAVSEYRRSYYIAKAMMRLLNHNLSQKRRLVAPLPMKGDEAIEIEEYEDEEAS